jgi:hypothetical protein
MKTTITSQENLPVNYRLRLPDGHRLFTNARNQWAIADDSGYFPQDTDDGILWLDFSFKLRITNDPDGTGTFCSIPVTDESGKPNVVGTNAATIFHLAEAHSWAVSVNNVDYGVTYR